MTESDDFADFDKPRRPRRRTIRWRKYRNAHGDPWYRSNDRRWEIRRRVEYVWQRTPIGDDNAEEPVTDWVTLADAKHLGAELAAAYPPPPIEPRWSSPPQKRTRRRIFAAANAECRLCHQPIYQRAYPADWHHLNGDADHDAWPASALKVPGRTAQPDPQPESTEK